jgi:hypothetical protein
VARSGFEGRGEKSTGDKPMQKALAAAIISSALIMPALAIAPEEYWVVQDATTKHCSVVAEKPMSQSMVVGSFKTRAKAETSIKTTATCSSH